MKLGNATFAAMVAASMPGVAWAQVPGVRLAQQGTTCPPGQAVTSDTEGHCCWPGQAWSMTRQVCVGIPQCPAGFAAQGQTCVPTTPPAESPKPGAFSPASAPATPPSGAPSADEQGALRPRWGLFGGGAGLLGAGYIISAGIGIGGQTYAASNRDGGCWAAMGAWPYVPLIGAIASVLAQGGHYSFAPSQGGVSCTSIPVAYPAGVAVAIIDTVMQVAGGGMMVLGLVMRTHEPLRGALIEIGTLKLRLAVAPGAPSAPAGFTLLLHGG